MKTRGFEVAKGYEDKNINLPIRKTAHAAAYDIESAEDITIPVFKPGVKPTLVPTGLKAYCREDECFLLFNRSSGPKKGLFLANGVGLIESDYYKNPTNDGHFYFAYFNCSDHDIEIKKGDTIGQIMFTKFLICDDDHATGKRVGGFGSTDIKKK